MKKNDIKNRILDPNDVENKIKRISLQIIEDNIDEKSLLLIGIAGNGKVIAEKIIGNINKFSDMVIEVVEATINDRKKFNVSYDKKIINYNQPVIIIGDVSQSGETLQLIISDIMDKNPPKIKTAIIVNRDHALFPVKIDFCGLSLSTSVDEHVNFLINKEGECSVYLN